MTVGIGKGKNRLGAFSVAPSLLLFVFKINEISGFIDVFIPKAHR